jgi:hypothetical protein
MKSFRHFTFAIATCAIISLVSCKKQEGAQPDAESALARKFFNLPSDASQEAKAISEQVKHQNRQRNFLSSVVAKAGFPLWGKAKLINLEGDASGVKNKAIFIPFAKDSEKFVNSLLVVKMSSTGTVFRMLYANRYREFGYDFTNSAKWNARDVFNIFSSFDYSVFRQIKHYIRDTGLFKSNRSNVVMTRIETPQHSSERMLLTQITECGTWEACPQTGLVARENSEDPNCLYIDICTTYYLYDGSDFDSGGGGWTGGGDGSGSGGSGGWYDGSGNPCSPAKLAIAAPDGCGSGWQPVGTGTAPESTDFFGYPDPTNNQDFMAANPNATDCNTFSFTKTGATWQEAGAKNLPMKVYYIDPNNPSIKVWLNCNVNQFVIGFPTRFSPGQAANMAAKAVDLARLDTYQQVSSNGGTWTEAQAVQYFRDKLNEIVRQKGGTASRVGSNSSSIIYKPVESSFWTDPYDC